MVGALLFALCTAAAAVAAAAAGEESGDAEDEAYFRPAGALGPPPWPVPRAAKLSAADFARHAARGLPLVVTDGARGLPMRGWTCADFATRFGGGHMRREYDRLGNPGDANTQSFADEAWITRRAPNGVPPGADPEAPRFAPYYWGVKESAWERWRGEAELLGRVQRLTAAPYFLAAHPSNLASMRHTPEFWMGANGTGAKAHMDGHCDSTVAVQLSGTRRWRLGRVPRSVRRSREQQFNDGDVYGAHYTNRRAGRWEPTYVATLVAGEALIFPPGFIHETLNVGGACAASVTYQWAAPAPAAYFRAFLPRLLRLGDLSGCHDRIRALATLGGGGGGGGGAGAALAARLDEDGDGVLSGRELAAAPLASRGAAAAADAATLVRDALLYHDSDGDGRVQLAELVANREEYWRTVARVAAEPAIDGDAGGGHGGEGEEEEEEEEEEETRDGDEREEL